MTCVNCKSQLSCGCQKRTASDGKVVCSNCIATYNRSVASMPPKPQATASSIAPQINSINYNK